MKFFKINFFYKPVKSDVLVYDYLSLKFAKKLFEKKKLSIFYARFDGLSIYILFKTFLKSGYKNFFKNYKINFFSFVKPKIIYTAIDNNSGFYKLKKIYPHAKYVSDQNGMRDEKFFDIMVSKKKFFDYSSDVIFCFGENEKKRLSKIINAKIYPLGNTLNNSYERYKIRNFEFKNLVFISHFKNEIKLKDLKFLNKLAKITFKMNKIFYFHERPNQNFDQLLNDKLKQYNFNYIQNKEFNIKEFYGNSIFIARRSTLGFSYLSNNYRIGFYGLTSYNSQNSISYNARGPFWTSKLSEVELTKMIKKIRSYDQKKWNLISNKYSYQLLNLDENNIKKKKIINKLLDS